MNYIVLGVLNPAMSAIFCITLLALWWHERQLAYIGLFALSYAIRAICFIIVFVALDEQIMPLRLVSNALILLSMALLSVGVSLKYRRGPHYALLSVIMLLTLSGLGVYIFVYDSLMARGAILGGGLAGICLIILADIPKREERTPVETLLFWLVATVALAFACRPLFAMPGIVGDKFEAAYWLAISISDTLICSTLAVGIFATIAADVTRKMQSDAESDFLSGLLNRRGFERRAKALLTARSDLDTSALIISDLDLFKSINDRCGHATGDKIILIFANLLGSQSSKEAIIARLGGEEFAIFLPSCDLRRAHEIAENIRTIFKASAPDHVRGVLRPTASFGIAMATGAEELQTLLERADRALYRAKKEGRDCVRGWEQHTVAKLNLAGS